MIRVLLAAAFPLCLAACATPGLTVLRSAGPIPKEIRSEIELQRIEVLQMEPEMDFPPGGCLEGLGAGFGRGLGMLVMMPALGTVAGGVGGGFGAILGGFLGAAAGALYFPFSLVNGMATAVPSEDYATAEAEIKRSVLDAPWAEAMRRQVRMPVLDPATRSDDSADPSSKAAVLEISVRRIGTYGSTPWCLSLWTLDVPVHLSVEVEGRLIRPGDRHVWGSVVVRYTSPGTRKFLAWAETGGGWARGFSDHAADRIASRIVEELFALEPK